MEILMLVLTIIGTIGTVVCTAIAVRAKNEAKQILKEIVNEKNRNVSNAGDIEIKNSGTNSGVIAGINTGEVNWNAEKK